MKLILLLSLAAQCPETLYENRSGLEWEKHDSRVAKLNAGACKRKYPKSPCVYRFIKLGYHNYYIICGKKKLDKSNITCYNVDRKVGNEICNRTISIRQ